jgi:cytoskeletal protein CcmA (bactofilin family)
MALFRRDEPDPAPTAPAVARRSATGPGRAAGSLIAAGTKVTGEIAGTADLTVEGEVEGTLRLDGQMTVAEGGMARGQLAARTVRIAGKVVGDVRGSELVELAPSGSLEGNISAARVVIAEGAFFKGQVEMTAGSKPAAPAPKPEPPPPRPS